MTEDTKKPFEGKNIYRRGTEEYKNAQVVKRKRKAKEISKELSDPDVMKDWLGSYSSGQRNKIRKEMQSLHGAEYLKIIIQLLEFSQPKISRVESKKEGDDGVVINLIARSDNNEKQITEKNTIDIEVDEA